MAVALKSSPAGMGMVQPQRGGMFIDIESHQRPSSVGAAWNPDRTPTCRPAGAFYVCGWFTINMPLLTELLLDDAFIQRIVFGGFIEQHCNLFRPFRACVVGG